MILSLFILLILIVLQTISFAAPNLYIDLKEQQNHNKYNKLFRSLNSAVELDKGSNKEVIYNYNDLLNEYFMQSDEDEETKSNNTYYEKSKGNESGFITLAKREDSLRLWKIIKIWFIIYLIFSIPLWCTRGWCCCCLICKFCKPRKTMEEAKTFLNSYPPGIFIINGKVIQYEPTEREKESYEEFEHLIRIL